MPMHSFRQPIGFNLLIGYHTESNVFFFFLQSVEGVEPLSDLYYCAHVGKISTHFLFGIHMWQEIIEH